MFSQENSHKRGYLLQYFIEEYPSFLQFPEKYNNQVFASLEPFIKNQEIFEDFLVSKSTHNSIDYITFSELNSGKIIYQIKRWFTNEKQLVFERTAKTIKGVRCLKIALSKILKEHTDRNIKTVFSDLGKIEKRKIEEFLIKKSKLKNKKNHVFISQILYQFFIGANTETFFQNYLLKADYQKDYFNFCIKKESLINYSVSFSLETGVVSWEYLDTDVINMLEFEIAKEIFKVKPV